jgi:hypothetical protein
MVGTPDGAIHQISLEGIVKDLKWSLSKKPGASISRLALVAGGLTLNDGKTGVVIHGT